MAEHSASDHTAPKVKQDPLQKPIYLDPSPLGTKEYWTSLYDTDLHTRQSTIPTHTGTTWFDDADAENKTVRYLSNKGQLSPSTTSFLDLGTGNGSLLFALRRAGYGGLMIGVDYAQQSIDLANSIWKDLVESGVAVDSDEDSDDEKSATTPSTNPIDFHVLDILSLANLDTKLPHWVPEGGFDVVLDKGTFDAVSLSADVDPSTGKRIIESYAIAARRFLKKPEGRMVVTSCNWIESELEKWFCSTDLSPTDAQLKLIDKVPYRRFQFGGKEGSVVVGLIFGWASH